jgi:hypothetical protein
MAARACHLRWQRRRRTEIPPPNNLESAVLIALAPGNYTAILSGVNNATGNALIEVYAVN